MYDVAIIGAGPAGLMAARVLKKANITFIVLDSKRKIGLPLKCGEGMRKEGFVKLFRHADYPFIKNKTKNIEVTAGKTKRRFHIDYLILDRPKFEQWLAKPIQNIKLNTKCIDIIKKSDYMEIITNKGNIKANLVILAYGCNYHIQKKFNLIKKIPLLAPCYGGIFTNHKKDADTIYFIFDDSTASALWIFPKDGHTANIGLGIVPSLRKQNLKAVFNKSLKKFNLKRKLSFAGIFPSSGPIKKTYTGRLLVCGNAAGQVYAGAGEGIYFALKAGQLAAITAVKSVKKRNFSSGFLKQYESRWKKSFGNQLKAGHVFASILYLGFKYRKLEKLFKLPKTKDLIGLFTKGKIPFKARIAFFFSILLRNTKKPPYLFKLIWKILC